MFSSNVVFEEFVVRSLKASPLIKPFLTPGGWQEEKCVYWNVSISEISAVNFMVAWWLLASCIKVWVSFLLTFHREKTSSMYLFYVSGFVALRPIISVSTAAIKILAKDTAIFVPIAVPCLWR